MENYQLPMKLETGDDEEYIVEHTENGDYDDDDLVSPTGHSESDWASLQDSAAGKLRLKRRRKCGQCGPCQVKENCDKCHFCLRRDVLKQSCIYRKCLYLRKKPSRVRDCVPPSGSGRHPSSSQSPSAATGSACVSTPAQNSTSPLSPVSADSSHCRLPQPSPSFVPGSSVTNQHLTPDPHRPLLGVDPLSSGFQPDPLRQLPVPPPPDPLRSSYQSPPQPDVLRSHSADQARSPHGDLRPMSSDTVRSLPTSQAPPTPVSVDQLRSMPADHLHHMQSESLRQFQNNHHLRPFQADQLRPPLGMDSLRPFPSEQYGMAYGPPRHVWPPPGLPSPYNFQANNMNMGASPSCRMSLPEACRYSMPTQPSFPHHPHHPHHHMPFNINSDFRPPVPFGTPSSLGPPMNPPFYPPPPVPPVPSTSLPTLPIVQYSASQEAYPGSRFAAPPMYTGSLYSPFRPPSEPYIYHAQFPPMETVFSGNGSKMAYFRDQFLRHCDDKSDISKDFHLKSFADDDKVMMLEKYKCLIEDSVMSSSSLKLPEKFGSKDFYSCKDIDDDLKEEMSRVTRDGQCNVCISIDDYKMQAFIRSDGVNNLEIEIESPVELSPNNTSSNKPKHSENHSNNTNTNNTNNSDSIAESESSSCSEGVSPAPRRSTVVGVVCVRQDLGDEGILQLEVPGHRVFLEDTQLTDAILSQSQQPSELIEFIQTPVKSCPESDDLIL